MKIVKAQEGTNAEFIKVQEIEGDMGEDERMQLLQQPDGDVILSFYNVEKRQLGSIEFCTSNSGGRYPIIAKKLRELIAELVNDEALKTINPIARMKIGECAEENPCCDRRNEYNGFASGPLKFVCPKNCSCHD